MPQCNIDKVFSLKHSTRKYGDRTRSIKNWSSEPTGLSGQKSALSPLRHLRLHFSVMEKFSSRFRVAPSSSIHPDIHFKFINPFPVLWPCQYMYIETNNKIKGQILSWFRNFQLTYQFYQSESLKIIPDFILAAPQRPFWRWYFQLPI